MTLKDLHQTLKEADAYLLRVRVALAEAEDEECMGEGCGEEADDEMDDGEDEAPEDDEEEE
jgi:hypothetical protein